jgi:hypothetical protein
MYKLSSFFVKLSVNMLCVIILSRVTRRFGKKIHPNFGKVAQTAKPKKAKISLSKLNLKVQNISITPFKLRKYLQQPIFPTGICMDI